MKYTLSNSNQPIIYKIISTKFAITKAFVNSLNKKMKRNLNVALHFNATYN